MFYSLCKEESRYMGRVQLWNIENVHLLMWLIDSVYIGLGKFYIFYMTLLLIIWHIKNGTCIFRLLMISWEDYIYNSIMICNKQWQKLPYSVVFCVCYQWNGRPFVTEDKHSCLDCVIVCDCLLFLINAVNNCAIILNALPENSIFYLSLQKSFLMFITRPK